MTEKQLIQHIKDFFGDTSRSASATLKGLNAARDECEELIEALRADGVE